jgi:membrane-associated phospholipid phosphatase
MRSRAPRCAELRRGNDGHTTHLAPGDSRLTPLEAFAQRHALAAILFALALVPLISAGLFSMLARNRTRTLTAAAATTLLGIAVFIVIAQRLKQGEAFRAADQRLLDAIHDGVPAFAVPWFAHLTHLGDPWLLTVLCALVCAALLLARRFGLAIFLAAVTSAGGLINRVLKLSMRRERPLDALVPLPESFSFPSGHTFGSIVCYGMCAYVLVRVASRRWDAGIVAAASFAVVLIGLSRVVIGVHFPGDVIGGLASGGAWLALCVGVAEWLRTTPRADIFNAR